MMDKIIKKKKEAINFQGIAQRFICNVTKLFRNKL